jgi:hypothetical protein
MIRRQDGQLRTLTLQRAGARWQIRPSLRGQAEQGNFIDPGPSFFQDVTCHLFSFRALVCNNPVLKSSSEHRPLGL